MRGAITRAWKYSRDSIGSAFIVRFPGFHPAVFVWVVEVSMVVGRVR
jgi:hypothetical protein